MSYQRPFACLSIRQPWASLIVAGVKDIENRTWQCKFRGPLLVHAGKTWGKDEKDAYKELLQIAIDHDDMRRAELIQRSMSFLGGIVGMVRMRGCVPLEWWDRRDMPFYDGWKNWFCGPYGFQFHNPVMLSRVIHYRGQQGLFDVPRGVLADLASEDEYERISGYFSA